MALVCVHEDAEKNKRVLYTAGEMGDGMLKGG